ncbi:MAG: hypothetical protein NC078_11565 [Ruminococcus sp.]|nr:hypothetical protein [Ruminococcus sp.]
MENKLQCKSAIVLGILGIIAGLFIPIIGVGLGVAGIIVAAKKKAVCKTAPGLVLSIIGTVTSLGIWMFNAVIIYQQMGGAVGQ